MSRPPTRLKRKRIFTEESAIRRIIQDWQPLGFPVPEDEYDCLVLQLIGLKHAGGSGDDVVLKIKDEIEDHFGLGPVPWAEIQAAAAEVMNGWRNREKEGNNKRRP